MSDTIEFSGNYEDDSTDNGFQFEFRCERCETGHRTKFRNYLVGGLSSALGAASSLFGGILGSAADVGERVRSAGWQKAHDEAFDQAWQEVKAEFAQCPHCNVWVCRDRCWNEKRGLCKNCAPDLGVEMSVAQSDRSVEEIHRHAAMAAEDKKLSTENWRETIRASCPECEAPLATNAKFCPQCGAKLKAQNNCTECGAKLTPGAKFCPECGTKTGSSE